MRTYNADRRTKTQRRRYSRATPGDMRCSAEPSARRSWCRLGVVDPVPNSGRRPTTLPPSVSRVRVVLLVELHLRVVPRLHRSTVGRSMTSPSHGYRLLAGLWPARMVWGTSGPTLFDTWKFTSTPPRGFTARPMEGLRPPRPHRWSAPGGRRRCGSARRRPHRCPRRRRSRYAPFQ